MSHISQGRGDDSALWSASCGREEFLILHIAAGEPLIEDFDIHGDIFPQPWVTDSVKAGFYISFMNPSRRVLFCQCTKKLANGITAGPVNAETI